MVVMTNASAVNLVNFFFRSRPPVHLQLEITSQHFCKSSKLTQLSDQGARDSSLNREQEDLSLTFIILNHCVIRWMKTGVLLKIEPSWSALKAA